MVKLFGVACLSRFELLIAPLWLLLVSQGSAALLLMENQRYIPFPKMALTTKTTTLEKRIMSTIAHDTTMDSFKKGFEEMFSS